jgi:antitoxin (DNA-binding transcriptional repressor) of toxin-antitoxin stability system
VNVTINARELRASLPEIVRRVRKGTRFTVLYRSRPAFDMIPAEPRVAAGAGPGGDSLYHALPVGGSGKGLAARQHDEVLYR